MELTYTNDQQIIADAARMLIESHLRWSGSNEGLPSEDPDNVRADFVRAYLTARFTVQEFDNLDEETQSNLVEMARVIFKEAARLADRKWQAAMTLLGIEQ